MMQTNYKSKRGLKRFFVLPLIIIVAVLLISAVVMLLWNAILPELLNVHPIGYWQAVGLLILCKILFGGFGPRRHGGAPPSRRMHWSDKWSGMTEEEKARFKEEWKRRCEQRKG